MAVTIALEETAKQAARALRGVAPWRAAFRLAQQLKGVPGADRAVEDDPTVLGDAVRQFSALMGPPHDDEDALYLAVCAAWERIRHPGGTLATALRAARSMPIGLQGRLRGFGDTFRTCLGVAYHLQRAAGAGTPIVLPQQALAELLGVAQRTVSDCLAVAIRVGLLRVIDATWSRNARKAKTYVFEFECLHYSPPDCRLDVPQREATPGRGTP